MARPWPHKGPAARGTWCPSFKPVSVAAQQHALTISYCSAKKSHPQEIKRYLYNKHPRTGNIVKMLTKQQWCAGPWTREKRHHAPHSIPTVRTNVEKGE